MDISALRDAVTEVGRDALAEVNMDPKDRQLVTAWIAALGIAMATGNKKEAEGYRDALSLTIAKYEVKAADATEKALLRTLVAVGKIAVAALL